MNESYLKHGKAVREYEIKKYTDAFQNTFTKAKKESESAEILQARILVSTLSYNTSVRMKDENGEWRTPPVPDPEEEEFLVKPGDQVSGFEVVSVTANFLELQSFMEYIAGNSSTPETHFLIEKGERMNLNMYGVYDAVHKTSITYVETVV